MTTADPFSRAEHVAETLDIGPGTRVFEVNCGEGEFLYPFQQNGYIVGGIDADAEAIARARKAMPDGSFQVGVASALDPAVPWHVVVLRLRADAPASSTGDIAAVDRGVLARMFAKATHAIALLGVPDEQRQLVLHALTEIGASAIQFDHIESKGEVLSGRESKGEVLSERRESKEFFDVFARV